MELEQQAGQTRTQLDSAQDELRSARERLQTTESAAERLRDEHSKVTTQLTQITQRIMGDAASFNNS